MAIFADVRAVYFDLDDTLCGYWDASKAALRQAFTQHGPEGVDAETMVRHWAAAFREFAPNLRTLGLYETYLRSGEPTRNEQMRRTLARLGPVDEAMAVRLGDAYGAGRNANLRLFEDVHPVLERLRAGGIPMGLITNGSADVQRQEIAALGLEGVFDPIYIEGEVGYGKPDPRVFASAAAAVGQPPDRILFVGNSYGHDIRPSIEAGWRTAWVRRATDVPPSATGEVLPESRPEGAPAPDLEIGRLSELLVALGE